MLITYFEFCTMFGSTSTYTGCLFLVQFSSVDYQLDIVHNIVLKITKRHYILSTTLKRNFLKLLLKYKCKTFSWSECLFEAKQKGYTQRDSKRYE